MEWIASPSDRETTQHEPDQGVRGRWVDRIGVIRQCGVRRPNVGAHPFDLASEVIEICLECRFGIRRILSIEVADPGWRLGQEVKRRAVECPVVRLDSPWRELVGPEV